MSNPSNPGNPRETSDEALHLDGNAAAGMLSEIFTHDMTNAQCTCAKCGRTTSLGSLMLYGGQTGAVLRCSTCDAVQMRVVYIPARGGQYWLDMSGMSSLRIAPAIPA
ncbi:MAG: DUF6510 family protein [Nitrososphaerota archaeon]